MARRRRRGRRDVTPFFGGAIPSTSTITEVQIVDGALLARVADPETITGLYTFNRGANAPFAVAAGSLVVANLDADKLDGFEAAYFEERAEESMFWNANS